MALACTDTRDEAKTPAKGAAAPEAGVSHPSVEPTPPARDECFAERGEGALENAVTKCGQGAVSQNGDSLAIRLSGGEFARYLSAPVEPQYHYVGRIGKSGGTPAFHVVDELTEGGRTFELINAVTGAKISVGARPLMSPDGSRFAVVDNGGMSRGPDEGICLGKSRVEVWHMTDTVPVNEFRVETFKCLTGPGWGPFDPAWRSADTLSFLRVRFPDYSAVRTNVGRDTARALLVRGPAGWALDGKSKELLPGR